MVRTNNGFEIAEADLQIRGPGEMEGTRQSGVNDFKLLSLAKDHKIMDAARYMAERLIEADSSIIKPEHEMVRRYLRYLNPGKEDWSRIS
jgi:ATP-dependent DNA helicase RecG